MNGGRATGTAALSTTAATLVCRNHQAMILSQRGAGGNLSAPPWLMCHQPWRIASQRPPPIATPTPTVATRPLTKYGYAI
jgi:hypothetical protein